MWHLGNVFNQKVRARTNQQHTAKAWFSFHVISKGRFSRGRKFQRERDRQTDRRRRRGQYSVMWWSIILYVSSSESSSLCALSIGSVPFRPWGQYFVIKREKTEMISKRRGATPPSNEMCFCGGTDGRNVSRIGWLTEDESERVGFILVSFYVYPSH